MDDLVLAFEAAVVGRSCRVERRETDWAFEFQDDTGFAVGCHWRLISLDGTSSPTRTTVSDLVCRSPSTENKANALFGGATVTSATVDQLTADICLRFSNDLRLDVVNNSSGYEGWQGNFFHGGKATSIIAKGGGRSRLILTAATGRKPTIPNGCEEDAHAPFAS